MTAATRQELSERQYQWLLHMPSWSDVRGQDVIDTYASVAAHRDALLSEVERLRDRAVCSGCGSDVDEGGACNYPGCDDGEMIPASELPLALREMRDRRDEWRQEAMSL